MAEQEQAVRDGVDQALEVFEGNVAGTAHVGRREEAEDVFGGLGQLPELWPVSGVDCRQMMLLSASSLTEAQYVSPPGMWRSSDKRKIPFLKTSFESLAPIFAAKIFAS